MARANSNSGGPLDHGSAGTPELFVYGTLVLDDVIRTLIDRVPASQDTSAPGWRAARLSGLPYPGLIADHEGEAPGRVYTDLSEDEWAVLDAFEDPRYVVRPVKLHQGRRALAYVWPGEALAQSWAVNSLDGDDMEAYLQRCQTWRGRFEERQRDRPHP